MPHGPFRRVVGPDPNNGIKGDLVRPSLFNDIYEALENTPTIDDLQSPVNLQGVLDSTGALPTGGNTLGDAYLVNGTVWVWDGSAWTDQGSLTQGPEGDPATLRLKGTKATTGDLPVSGNVVNDVWIVDADGHGYGWTMDHEWVDLGPFQGPEGPGGADTDLRERTERWFFDVTHPDYGAVGDGSTDDTAAINLAIAAAVTAGGGEVFFPAGTYLISPTTAAWLTMASNITYSGSGYASCIKVKANAGNYSSVFRTLTTATRVENVVFRDLRIDQNAGAQTTATAPLGSGILQCQFAIAAWDAKNVTVDHVWFDTCTGVNTVYINGDSHEDVTDIAVRDCMFRWVILPNATNPTAEHRAYDNSAIYIVADVATVHGNAFRGDPLDGPRGCCEFHGPNMTFTANHAFGYQTLINLGTMAADYDGIANWVVSGNTGYQLNNAVVLVSASGGDTENISVVNNLLHHDTATHGLGLGWAIAMGGGSFAGLDISHNIIAYEPDDRTTDWTTATLVSSTNGDYFTGIYVACATGETIAYGRIANNTIINAPTHGITIGAQSAGTVKHLDVYNNQIVDCGRMQTWYAASPAYVNVQGTVQDTWIRNNTIIDNGSGASIGYMSYRASSAINLLAATRLRIDEGEIKGTGAAFLQSWGYAPAEIERHVVRAVKDPGSIAAGGEYTTTVAFLGVTAADLVIATPGNGIEAGLFFYAYVSAPDEVTLSIRNYTGSPIDPASRTWRFYLTRTELDV